VSSSDTVKAQHKFPKASYMDVAKTIVDHFEVTKSQAAAIRHCTTAMVSTEQSILTKIRWLLTAAVDGDGVITALRIVHDFLSMFEAADDSTPFQRITVCQLHAMPSITRHCWYVVLFVLFSGWDVRVSRCHPVFYSSFVYFQLMSWLRYDRLTCVDRRFRFA